MPRPPFRMRARPARTGSTPTLVALLLGAAVVLAPALAAPAAALPAVPVVPAVAVATDLTPAAGPTSGGTRVSLAGWGLEQVGLVTFAGVPGRDLEVVSGGEVRVTTPPGAEPGGVTVLLRTGDGRFLATSPVRFRYGPLPAVTDVAPATGAAGRPTLVSVEGTDLGGTTSVRFGDVEAQVLQVTPTRVRVLAPALDAGPADVLVTNPIGTSAAGAVFDAVPAPTIAAVSPATGSTAGGTEVTVTGEHLTGTREVTFGGTPGTDLRVVSDTELRVTAPPRATVSDVDLHLTSASGIRDDGGTLTTFGYVAAQRPEPVEEHGWWPLGLIGLLSWSVWGVRRYLSRHRYEPVHNDFRTSTSVVVPVYREDADVLERCLRTWLREDPTEVVLVVDDQDQVLLDRLAALDLPRVRVLEWRHTGKRGALGAGVRAARGEIVVFADSDTEWRPGLLAAMQMPFVDPRVGGVGSRQHVYRPESNVWRRVAYWMLNSRYLDYVPAMSRRGGVACLSGRTAAYRRSLVRTLMPALEHEVFLGRECVAGDDGRLTWLVLAAGYRTVHQDTAQADSMFPSELRAFLRQRIRWSRNSYRCYLTALAQGWLWRRPLITQVTVLQILLTPVSMGAAAWYGTRWVVQSGWSAAAVVVAWAVIGRALRGTSHLRERPRDLWLAPLMAVTVATIALPVKLWAAVTMNRQGWLTRQAGGRVQGQQEIRQDARQDARQGIEVTAGARRG